MPDLNPGTRTPLITPDDYIAVGSLEQVEKNPYINNGTLNYYYNKKISSCCE